MSLDECRDALEMTKLSRHTDSTEAIVRNLLDWAEDVQQYLEAVAAEAAKPAQVGEVACDTCEGHGHVVAEMKPETQIWDLCPTCKGRGKIKLPQVKAAALVGDTMYNPKILDVIANMKPACPQCHGVGTVDEDGVGFTCSMCDGTGEERLPSDGSK